MTPKDAEEFYSSIPDADKLKKSELVDYFVYWLTNAGSGNQTTREAIDQCFDACGIGRLARLSSYLSEASTGSRRKLIRDSSGYRLERRRRDEIALTLSGSQPKRQVKASLRKLEQQLPSGARREFLAETVTCFEVGAYRAAIVMCWLLTLDVLFEYILANKLADFNLAVSKHSDKKINNLKISTKDDFSDIAEGKFIELCRSAGVYNNDIRKILDQKLGIRNSSAHPSTIKLQESKALEFVEDLTHNVIIRFI